MVNPRQPAVRVIGLLAILAGAPSTGSVAQQSERDFGVVGSDSESDLLCEALRNIQDGDKRTLTTSGMVVVGLEMQVLFDPNDPKCGELVQPSTWVEFALGEADKRKLDAAVEGGGAALVRIEGVLFGPAVSGPDDPSLPVDVSYFERTAGRRFGHLNSFRTKFVAQRLLKIERVSTNTAESLVTHRGPVRDQVPKVVHTEVPRYPERARRANIEGDVEVETVVADGEIIQVTAISGDRLFVDDAECFVRGLRFSHQTTERFVVRLEFRLEDRGMNLNSNPRIELDLPYRARVTDVRNRW